MPIVGNTKEIWKAQADQIRACADLVEKGVGLTSVSISPHSMYTLISGGKPMKTEWTIVIEICDERETE